MCFRITSCCWCFDNPKEGSSAVGLFTLVISFISLIIFAVILGKYNSIFETAASQTLNNNDHAVNNSFLLKAVRICIILAIIWCILCMVVSITLLYGILTANRLYLIPWMIWMMSVIILQSILFISCFVAMFYISAFGSYVVGAGTFLGFQIYCHSCVYSHYKNLGESNESTSSNQNC